MKCPWKLNVPNSVCDDNDCQADCAWLITNNKGNVACAMALLATKDTDYEVLNTGIITRKEPE